MLVTPAVSLRIEQLLESAAHPNDLIEPCRLLAQSLGFDWYVLGVRVPQPRKNLQVVITGLPESWNRVYDELKFAEIDPLIINAVSKVLPFSWDEIDWQSSPRVASMRAYMIGMGGHFGMTVGLHGPGAAVGIFNFARREFPITRNLSDRTQLFATAHLYATKIYAALFELVSKRHVREAMGLSDRELELLTFGSRGMFRIKQLAAEMGLSERTIAGMMGRIADKVGANSFKEALSRIAAAGIGVEVKFPEKIAESTEWICDRVEDNETISSEPKETSTGAESQ